MLKKEEQEFAGSNFKDDAYFIENKIISTKINGYKTEDVFHKKAREFEISLFESLASKKSIIAFKSILEHTYHFYGKIYFHSWGYSAHKVFQDIFGFKNFTLIDITGEITDVVIVEE